MVPTGNTANNTLKNIRVLLQRRLNECNVSSRPISYYPCLPSLYLLSEEEGEIMDYIKENSLINAGTRDRTYAIYRLLVAAQGRRIPPTRAGISAGINNQSTMKYVKVLCKHGLLEELLPPENYRRWRDRAIRTTPKGKEAIELIKRLYELFDIELERGDS